MGSHLYDALEIIKTHTDMPVISSDRFAELKPRIMRQVRSLVNGGALRLSADHGASLTLGFAFDVQWVKAGNKTNMRFGEPGGIGVLLLYGQDVVASLDLHFSGERLKFSHAQKGRSLDDLVTALNMVGARYQDDRKSYSIVQLHFPIGRGLYFKVTGGSGSAFFQYAGGQLRSMKAEELKTHFHEIIKNRKPLTPKL
jgi:hypothetical protein